MIICKKLLDDLTDQAKENPRLRHHFDLRDSEEDNSQRMFNVIEPSMVIPIHRHPNTSEDVIILRGVAEEVFFDDNGQETARYRLIPGGDTPAIHIPQAPVAYAEQYAVRDCHLPRVRMGSMTR